MILQRALQIACGEQQQGSSTSMSGRGGRAGTGGGSAASRSAGDFAAPSRTAAIRGSGNSMSGASKLQPQIATLGIVCLIRHFSY